MSIHQQKMIRFTLDMPPDMHRHLKIICAEDGISMNMFIMKELERGFKDREDRVDEEAIAQSIRDIASEGTISLAEMDRAMEV